MKKHFGIALALLSILITMSLASTVNADNWGVSEGDSYEWDVKEATEGYEEFNFWNGTFPTSNRIGLEVTTGDVIKFTIDELNTSDTSGQSCRGTLEIGNDTIENTDQASIAGALVLGAFALFQPGLISAIDWDTVKDNADNSDWNHTESDNSITFTHESESSFLDTTFITTAEITYDKDNGLLTEGKTNVTTDVRIPPMANGAVLQAEEHEIIVTAISLELVEDEGTDWMLIGAVAVAIAVIAILVVLIKR